MADSSRLCSVFLGSETGILKGVSLSRKQAFNFCNTQHLSREQEVRVLCWNDQTDSELLVGCVDGCVKTFSTEKGLFTESKQCGETGDGGFTGLEVFGDAMVTCVQSGSVKVWRENQDINKPVCELKAGLNVCRMRQDPTHRNKMATGGKENSLRIWDLEKPEAGAVFTAKNLRDDWLDLRRPHWVRDMAFIPGGDKVVTCTGYHQIHVFDPSTPQRRPVLEAEYGEFPLTALSLTPEGNTVVVGNTHGHIAMLDLRKGAVKGVLKGLSGGVRALQCHVTKPIVASCGLDRFLRIHSLEDRKVMHRVYLKSRLNCVLMARGDKMEAGGDGATDGVKKEENQEEEEEDEVWASMETVTEATKRKSTKEEEEEEEDSKDKEEEEVQAKKKKKKNKGKD